MKRIKGLSISDWIGGVLIFIIIAITMMLIITYSRNENRVEYHYVIEHTDIYGNKRETQCWSKTPIIIRHNYNIQCGGSQIGMVKEIHIYLLDK